MRRNGLNQAYRLVWSEINSTWVAVSELTSARGKRSGAVVAAALVIGMLGTPASATTDTISVSTGGTYYLDSGNTVIVNSGVSLSGNAALIAGAGGGVIQNSGTIGITSGTGVVAFDSVAITNHAGALIQGGGIDEIALRNLGATITTLDNAGTIQVVSGSLNSSAVGNYNAGNIQILTNTGTISATGADASAIVNEGNITNLTNGATGTIVSAGGYGIWNKTSSQIGTLTNEAGGTITGGGDGIFNDGGNVTLINGGRIYTNNTVYSAIRNEGSNATLTITNSSTGVIQGASAINNQASATISSLTNDGTITGSGDGSIGIFNAGIMTTITNNRTGVISGDSQANFDRALVNTGTIGTITNDGTISSATSKAISNFGTIESIRNTGTIKGGAGEYAIYNTGTIHNGITNLGTLDGAVALGSASLNLGGRVGRVTGAVTGDTGSIVRVNSIFTTENTFAVDNFIITGDSTLNQAHQITVGSGGFENYGTLAVAAGPVVNITGDYTQYANGTFTTHVNDDTHYGKLQVTGTATLPSNAKIYVDVANANFGFTTAVTNGLPAVITASHLVSDGTFNVTTNSVLVDFTGQKVGDQVDLLLTLKQGGDNSNGSSAIQASTDREGNSPAHGAAGVLDTMLAGYVNHGSSGNTDMDTVIQKLIAVGTSDKSTSDAVAQTLPLMTAGMNQVASNTLHGTSRVIQARQDSNIGISTGDDFLGDKKIWLKPVGSWARQGARKGVTGYDADTYGMVGGIDGEFNDSNRIGIALSYMHSNVDGKSTSSSNSAGINAYQAIVYGSHSLANISDAEVSWQADLGINKNEGQRRITFGGLNRVAKADYNSTTAHIGAGIARNYQLNDKTTLTPAVRADYTYIRDEGYTETGADALNLKVNGHSTDELIVLAEGRLSHKLSATATLVANAGIGYDVLHGRNSITASYTGGGSAFSTTGLEASPWLGRAGAGVVMNANERTEISARYDLEGRSNFVDQTASVKVRWAF